MQRRAVMQDMADGEVRLSGAGEPAAVQFGEVGPGGEQEVAATDADEIPHAFHIDDDRHVIDGHGASSNRRLAPRHAEATVVCLYPDGLSVEVSRA